MKIGYFQYHPFYHDILKNHEYIKSRLGKTSADLLVLPELSLSGYLFGTNDEVLACAETIPGPSSDMFLALAKKTQTSYIYGCIEKADPEKVDIDGSNLCYNSSVFINPQGEIITYRKAHLFNREKIHFIPGNDPFFVFDVQGVSVGMLICFDHMFPEAARTLTLLGAQIICHPSNLVLTGYAQATTLARSIENQIYWILANRIGTEKSGSVTCTYTGGSQITAPDGSILISSSAVKEDIQVIDIDPSLALNKSISKRNHIINDRRTDLYRV
ncbi:MAG: hypothetical protein HQ557_05215 [Bacteroidetes bacterium]|nr:hypothetical protein [Bacteroidota bacterium]